MFEQNDDFNENDDFQDAEEEHLEDEFNEFLEKMDREKIREDRRLSNFDIQKGIMQSEYGNNEFSNSAEITETGDYDLDLDRRPRPGKSSEKGKLYNVKSSHRIVRGSPIL